MDNESREMTVDTKKVEAAAAAAGVAMGGEEYVPANGFLKALQMLRLLIEGFCKICLIGQVVVTTIVVIGRYVFNSTPGWGEQLSLIFMVYFCLVSACLPVREDAHLRMTLIEKIVPKKVVRAMDLFAYLCMFVFGVVMITSGIDLVKLGARSRLSGLPFMTRSWVYWSTPIAGFALCASVVEKVVILCQKQ